MSSNSGSNSGFNSSSYSTSQSDAWITYHCAETLAQSDHGMTYQGGIGGYWTNPTKGNPQEAAQLMQVSADLRAQSMNHHKSMDSGHLNSWYSAQDAADRINRGLTNTPSYTTPTCYAGSSYSNPSYSNPIYTNPSNSSSYNQTSSSSYSTSKSNGTRCYVCYDKGCVSCGGGSSSWSNQRVNM